MLAAEVAIYQAFPGGGPFPYPAADLIGITAFALCGLLLARGSQLTRPLAGLFLAYLAIAWWAKLFPSPLGGNATRVLDYLAAPLLALVIAVRGPQARALGVLALTVAIAWQAAPFVQNVARLVRRAGAGRLVLAAGDLVPAPAGPPRSRQLPRRGRLHGAPLRVVLPHARRGRGDSARLVPAERLPHQRRALRPHAERRRVSSAGCA